MSSDKLATELKSILLKRIQSDQLVVPTIPSVVQKVQEALREGDQTVAKRAAEILEQDAFLAARALRAALGSTKASSGQKQPTLSDAVTKLGPRGVKGLLIEATAQKVFVSRDGEIANALRRTWEHSVAVGTLARDVLALSGHADSDAAYLAGLLHDIGKPVVASVLLEAERQTTELYNRPWIPCAEWVEVIAKTHRAVGVALAEKWQLPEGVVKCLQENLDYDNADRTSIVNAVVFANALAKKTGVYVGTVDADDIDAIVMIGRSLIGVNDEILRTLTKGLKDRVDGMFD
ncbi:MAG: histidine kinase [Anaeromyxobacter sp. RBG_16_69_14]|nr:MAG: histidine kinase [Anaeromyxobacter sp. RBG_16_69_14]